MDEKEIIAKLQLLNQIKPRQEWVRNTRKNILGPQDRWVDFSGVFMIMRQPIFAVGTVTMILLLVLAWFGLLNKPQQDSLELAISEIASDNFYDYNYYLEKASQTLAKAESASQENEKLVEETKQALKKAAEKLPSRPKNPQESAKIVEKVKEIEEKLTTLAPEDKELTDATKELKEKTKEMIETEIYRIRVEAELAMLENRTLTEEQQSLLEEAKKDYNNQDYLSALEKILQLTNQ